MPHTRRRRFRMVGFWWPEDASSTARAKHFSVLLPDAVVLDDGRVLIAAGGDDVEVVDPVAGTSRVVVEAVGSHWFTTLTRLGGGDLMMLGGYDDRIRLRREVRFLSVDAFG